MKPFLLILSLCFAGCTLNTEDEVKINEAIVFDEKSNWNVKFDSLTTIDNYILAYRELRRNGLDSIRPYIYASSGQRISLREVRQSKGSGYFWDCRAHLRIFVNPNGSFFCSWNSGKSCASGQIINNEKEIYNPIELRDEIFKFYSSNCLLEFETKLNDNDLEVWIIPVEDSLSHCKNVIESTAIAYQKFRENNLKVEIPLSIVLSPLQDKDRMKRVLKEEKT